MIDHLTASTFPAMTLGKLFKEMCSRQYGVQKLPSKKRICSIFRCSYQDRTMWSKAIPVDLLLLCGGEEVIACFERATGIHLNRPGL